MPTLSIANRPHRLGAALAMLVAASAAGAADIGTCGPEPAAASAPVALFSIDGESRTESDLSAALQQALHDARVTLYQRQLELIDAAVLESELDRRAAREGKSREAVARALMAVPTPTDDEVDAFYQANRARIPYPLDAVRERVRETLVQRAVQSVQAEVVAAAKRERGFVLGLEAPLAPFVELDVAGLPSKGPDDAKVTVVEFADYQCPHCKRASEVLDRIAARYPNDVRVVFADFPINPSGISREVAHGAACADRQGRFWAYHDRAFARQESLDAGAVAALAVAAGLDATAFESCMASPFPAERVAQGEGEARRLGLRATPTLFLNGRRLHLHDLESELARAIDQALAAGGGA